MMFADNRYYIKKKTDYKPVIILLYIGLYFTLYYGYAYFIIPIFTYEGFEWVPNLIKIFESIIILIAVASLLPSTIQKPSDFLVHVHFVLPVVPMLVLYGASDMPREYFYFVIIAFCYLCLVRKIKLPAINKDYLNVSNVIWGLVFIVTIYIIGIILLGGLRYFNLNLLKVYEFRSEASKNLPGISGYLSPAISSVILPILLILSVRNKYWLVSIFSIGASILMFALTSHKGPLFYPFFVLAIYYLIRKRKQLITLFLAGNILLILLSISPYVISEHEVGTPSISRLIAGSIIVRRGYFEPSRLNYYYYSFFSSHPYTSWAESKLTFGLIDYSYDLSSPHIIGYYFFHNANMGANTGWLGAGFMQLGFIGMLIYATIVGILLRFTDICAKNRDIGLSVAIIFTPFLSLFISSDLPTVLFTHGLLLALIITWVCDLRQSEYPRNKE